MGSLSWVASGGSGTIAHARDWESYPWIAIAAGYENDRLLEQGSTPTLVPGGHFVDLRPGLLLSRSLGARSRLNFDAGASIERFDNDENRSLFGGAVNGEFRQRFGSVGRWRLTAGTNYFGDSVQDGVNRFRLGAEAAVGVVGRRGFVEFLAGAQGRRFPDLITLDATGDPGTYTEYGASVGATGAVRPNQRIELSAYTSLQTTQARDPQLDARTLMVQCGLSARLFGPLQGFASGLAQERVFTASTAAGDSDEFWQLGVGLAYPFGRSLDLVARYARAEYTNPVGDADEIERFSVGLRWWPGSRGIRSLPDPAIERLLDEEMSPLTYAGELHRFRVRAADARGVAVVGEFNGWDPRANPMDERADDWWETEIALPVGSFQYAYWVDGELLTPPEARSTVDDGFGGRNGLITVEGK